MKVVFEGGGFPAFWYGLGYGLELLENETPTMFAGYSAGSLVAAVLCCCSLDVDSIIQMYTKLPFGSRFWGMERFIETVMDMILPPNAHEEANKKLGIILCDPNNDSKCKLVRHWECRAELIKCLIASCYIPCLMGCSRCSDELYQCRDPIFSNDLRTYLLNFEVVVGYPVPENFNILRFCENMNITSRDRSLMLFEWGALSYAQQHIHIDESTNCSKN